MKTILLKRIKALIICIALIISLFVGILVNASNSYIEQARVLYDLGLYNGISRNYFEPDLESFVDRETAVVFLLRLCGKAPDANDISDSQVYNIFRNYNDNSEVSEWARRYIAYAINNNLYPSELQGAILPKRFIDGKTFAGILQNCMGFYLKGDQWTISTYINSYLGGVSADDAKYLNDKIITKNEMIAMVWESFDILTDEYTTFLNMVVENNDISTSLLTRHGFKRVSGKFRAPIFNINNLSSEYNKSTGYNMTDGSKYSGVSSGGVPNGFGVVRYSDGSVYEGYVSAGKRHGEGKLVRSDGFVYIGGWANDIMSGYATMTWSSGDKYVGDVADGSFQGRGTMVWASGNEYTGEWWAGNFHGLGKFKWNNGNFYDGEWYMGTFNGYGKLSLSNGEYFEVIWKNGKKHGHGKHVRSDGSVITGRWENDEFIG